MSGWEICVYTTWIAGVFLMAVIMDEDIGVAAAWPLLVLVLALYFLGCAAIVLLHPFAVLYRKIWGAT